MSFTYDFNAAPDLSRVRLLCSDTDPTQPVFQDAEVNDALQMFSSQNMIVGLSGFSPAIPVTQVYSHRRSAASLLRALAANKARLGAIGKQLDIQLDFQKVSAALLDLAKELITSEENDGYFAVSEMVLDAFSMRERLWKQLYRLSN